MIKLFGNASPNVAKIIYMLEEVGLPFEHIWVNQYEDEQFGDTFTALNPNAKVPAIVDVDADNHAVFESGAILIYLAEKTGRLLPRSEPARSTVIAWLMVQMASVGPTFGQYNHFSNPVYSNETLPYARQRFGNEAHRILAMVERRLTQSAYFGGESYSVADIAMYPWMCLLDFIGLPSASLTGLQQWRDRIGSRPAIVRGDKRWDAAREKTKEQRMAATPEQLDRYFGRVARIRIDEQEGYDHATR